MSLGGVVGGGENLNPKGVLLVKVWVILVTLMSPPAVKTGLLSPCVAIWVSLFSTRLTRQFATMLTIDAMMDNTSASTLTLYSTPQISYFHSTPVQQSHVNRLIHEIVSIFYTKFMQSSFNRS